MPTTPNSLLTDEWARRAALGAPAEQAAMRTLHTMLSAAVDGKGVHDLGSELPTGESYAVVNQPGGNGPAVRYQAFGGDSFVPVTKLVTPAGQALLSASFAAGDGTFAPRDAVVEALGTPELQTHRHSATDRVQVASAVQDSLQEAIESPGQVTDLVQRLAPDGRVRWMTPAVDNGEPVYEEAPLSELVTPEGMQLLSGEQMEVREDLEPDDLVTERFRNFQDAAESEHAAMNEVAATIVNVGFGTDPGEVRSAVDFRAEDGTVASLPLEDLVSAPVAESLVRSEPTNAAGGIAGASSPMSEVDMTDPGLLAEKMRLSEMVVEARTMTEVHGRDYEPSHELMDEISSGVADAAQRYDVDEYTLNRQINARAEAETAKDAAGQGSVAPAEMFSPAYFDAMDSAIEAGKAGESWSEALSDLRVRVQDAASGHGTSLNSHEPWTAEEEPDPFGVDHLDLRAEGAGVLMSFWQIDGMDGVVDSREMLSPQGQAVLAAALDAGEEATFDAHAVVQELDLDTGRQAPVGHGAQVEQDTAVVKNPFATRDPFAVSDPFRPGSADIDTGVGDAGVEAPMSSPLEPQQPVGRSMEMD